MNIACMIPHFWEVLLWLGWQQLATTNIMQIVQSGKKENQQITFYCSVKKKKWKVPIVFLPRPGSFYYNKNKPNIN